MRPGAPGVAFVAAPADRSLQPVRLDVTGFAGVAPRGPIDDPVLVRSWSDYEQTFGGRSGPGLLGHAVAAFFAQGGERAHVVRVGPRGPRTTPDTDPAVARYRVGAVELAAANPGSWAERLTVRLRFVATSLFPVLVPGWDVAGAVGPSVGSETEAPAGIAVPVGTLLRVRGGELPDEDVFRWVQRHTTEEVAPGRRVDVLVLDEPVRRPQPDDAGSAPVVASVVTAELTVEDADPELPRAERLVGLGLAPGHPRFLADVLSRESRLVVPIGSWPTRRIPPPDVRLAAPATEATNPGRDIHADIDFTGFLDERGDADLDESLDQSGARPRGTTALARVEELGLLVVPDLFWAWRAETPDPDIEPPSGEAGFVRCGPAPPPTRYRDTLPTPLLDARTPSDRAEMQRRQVRLVELAERYRRFVVLLDVPAGMSVRDISRWRARFDSSYAAAYHPWLRVDEGGAARVRGSVAVPPSAFAAGTIAARELRLGLPWGPANELAVGAVAASAEVSDAEHDTLHPLGINVFRAERDGFRLTAARTLSRDRDFRQLSVRRLMTMLRLAVEREAQWVVFEPHTVALRELLKHVLLAFLSGLYRAGAFAGATESDAYFVRVDDDLNPRASTELGRLVVEVGVAPVEPLEFIVVRLRRDGDGGIRVEEAERA